VNGSNLTGTPTAAGTFSNVNVTVIDSSTHLTAQKTFSVTIAGSLAITTSNLPSGAVGTPYSTALAASGGSGNYKWSATGLPVGLVVSGNAIVGTPMATGTYSSVSITANDASSGLTTRKTFTITVERRRRSGKSSVSSLQVGRAPSESDNNIDSQ